MSDADAQEDGEIGRSETVKISAIVNYEIDPNEVDLRCDDIRNQLGPAIIDGSDRLQQILGTTEEGLDELRQEIWEAKHGQ